MIVLWTSDKYVCDYLVRCWDYFTDGPSSTVTSQGVANGVTLMFHQPNGEAYKNQRNLGWIKNMLVPLSIKDSCISLFDI